MTTILIYLLLAVFLLILNAFFVLAEFATVKMRPTRVEQLIGEGHARAKLIRHIQSNMDEYLAVCQVGITVSSICLGAVAEPAFARLIVHLTGLHTAAAHGVAVTAAIVLTTALHVVLGEQVPKMVAINRPEGASFLSARPLRFFRALFYLPLVILNAATGTVLRIFGIRGKAQEVGHSQEELKILLAQSQSTGLMSFRRLLLLENVFDLGGVKVRDAMRPREAAKVLRAGASWEENLEVIRQTRCSRYPLVDGKSEMPLGVVHIKDILYEGPERMAAADLRKIARPYPTTQADAPLEDLLSEIQRHRGHLAMVHDASGHWVGFLSLEDILEEVVGTIEDEFEVEPAIYLADGMTETRVFLGVQAPTLLDAIRDALGRIPAGDLPIPMGKIAAAVLERERAMSTYLGNGLAIPHARLDGLERPALVFARSEAGVPIPGRDEKAHFLFILLTPAGSPRVQVRLLARVCALVGSDYVSERLRRAASPAEVLEAVREAELVTLS